MPRPEIQARLDHICVNSPDPDRLAAFLERGYGMQVTRAGEFVECSAAERRVLFRRGPANQLAFAAYAFATREALGKYRERVAAEDVPMLANPSPAFGADAFAVANPDGHRVVFGVRPQPAGRPAALPGRLQHAVFRSTAPDAMVEFYATKLGFVVSDRVQDAEGVLRACFLRSDPEHHSIAIFRAPESRLDHFSFETLDWEHIRRWADDLALKRIPIFWGVGRHGPGNDLFFMVKDPDENLVEISAEIEQCADDRAMGIWPHEQRTLNVWGNAIMRS